MPLSRIGLSQNQQITGNVTFSGTGNRIRGDFSNATQSNRVAFQTSTTNASSIITVIPNGTSNSAVLLLENNSSPANNGFAQLTLDDATVSLRSGIRGTGTYLPLTMFTGGSERLRIDTSGNVGIGTSSPSTYGTFVVNGASNADAGVFIGNLSLFASAPTYKGTVRIVDNPTGVSTSGGLEFMTATFGSGYGWRIASIDSSGVQLTFATRQNSASWTESMRIDSGGNLLVGATTSVGRITMKQPGDNTHADGITFVRGSNSNSAGFVVGSDNNLYLGFNAVSKGVFNNGTGAYTTISDRALKENISEIPYGLSSVLALNPVQYIMIGNEENQLGFIAQETKEVIPESVSEMMGGYLGMDKSSIIPVLVKAIQELKATLDAQAARIATLEAK
jgi:hypothetical protein